MKCRPDDAHPCRDSQRRLDEPVAHAGLDVAVSMCSTSSGTDLLRSTVFRVIDAQQIEQLADLVREL